MRSYASIVERALLCLLILTVTELFVRPNALISNASAQSCPLGKFCFYVPPGMRYSHSPYQTWQLVLASSYGTVTGNYRIGMGEPQGFSVEAGTPLRIELSSSEGVVGNYETVEQRGIFVEAESDDLTVTHRRDGGNEQASETIKDHTRALGTRFRLGSYSLNGLVGSLDTPYDIVSIYSPTGASVTITAPPDAPMPFWEGSSDSSITVSLAAGETYMQRTRRMHTCSFEHNGALVTSDKPISVSSGGRGWASQSGTPLSCSSNGGCGDDGQDHIFPTNKIGKEYVVAKYSSSGSRLVSLIADQDDTVITVDGSTVGSLAAGKAHYFQPSGVHYIQSTKPIYVYQNTGLGSSCELGFGFVPPISFSGTLENFASFDVVGTGAGNIVIETDKLSTIQFDGAPLTNPVITEVPGRPELSVVSLNGLTNGGHLLEAKADFQLGVVSHSGPSGLYSYYNIFNLAGCGDGSVDPGEGCDDGNNISGDGCSAQCRIEVGHGSCSSDTDCIAGGFCNASNTCVGCLSNSDCNDANSCTDDICDASGLCSNLPRAAGELCPIGVCNGDPTNLQCVTCIDDSPPGSIDSGCPLEKPTVYCDESGASPLCRGCHVDSDCDDGNSCTTDQCNAGLCEHSSLSAGTPCGSGAGLCNGSSSSPSCTTCLVDPNSAVDPGCSQSQPYCDRSGEASVCARCLANSQCPLGQVCDTSKMCQTAGVNITSPLFGSTLGSPATIQGTATSGSQVVITITNTSGELIENRTITAFQGTWSLTTPSLIEGSYFVDALVNGNGITTSDSILVFIDSTVPPLTIEYPPQQAILNASSIIITGQSESRAHVEVTLNGVMFSVLTDTNGHWSLSVDNITSGEHTLSASAIDIAGNRSSPVNSTFTVLFPLGERCDSDIDCSSQFCDVSRHICACSSPECEGCETITTVALNEVRNEQKKIFSKYLRFMERSKPTASIARRALKAAKRFYVQNRRLVSKTNRSYQCPDNVRLRFSCNHLHNARGTLIRNTRRIFSIRSHMSRQASIENLFRRSVRDIRHKVINHLPADYWICPDR